jgi:hypothetical protein
MIFWITLIFIVSLLYGFFRGQDSGPACAFIVYCLSMLMIVCAFRTMSRTIRAFFDLFCKIYLLYVVAIVVSGWDVRHRIYANR